MRSLALEAFGGLTGRLIWLGLLNALWLGLLAASACALIFRAAPRLSHPTRHAVLLVAMIIVTTGPVAATALQHLAGTLPIRNEPAGTESPLVVITDLPFRVIPPASTPLVLEQPRSSRTQSWHLPNWEVVLAPTVALLIGVQPIVVPAWLLVVANLSVLLGLGVRGMQRLCGKADPAPEFIQERARWLARRLRLRKVPRVLIHPSLAEPCLCGVYGPVILLPGPWIVDATPERLDAILAHELAHARRLDPIVNLAQRLVETLLFFHPAVHWLSRSLRRERELCTDALAVRLTRDPMALAEALESVARLRLHFRSPAGLPIAGMSLGGERQSLLPRIQELIGMMPTRPRLPVWSFVTLPAAGLVALVATAAGLAQVPPSTSASARSTPIAPDSMTLTTSKQTSDRENASTKDSRPSIVDHAPKSQQARMIEYQVRYVENLDPDAWRNLLKDRLKLIRQDADVSAWIMDDNALLELLTFAQNDTRTNVLMAPKCTGYEGARATVISREKQFYVASVERVENAKGAGFRPIIKDLDVGHRIDMNGSLLPGGTRLSVDLSDSTLLSVHTMSRRESFGGRIQSAQYQVPTALKRRCEVSCDLPEHANLVISLGLSEHRSNLSGIAGIASDLLASVGLPKLEGQSTTFERLIIISTRWPDPRSEKHPVTTRPLSVIESRRGTLRQ